MDGRSENEIKLFKRAERLAEKMPPYVNEWCFLMMAGNTGSTCYDYINKIYNFLKFINPNVCDVTTEDITLEKVSKYYRDIILMGNSKYASHKCNTWTCLNKFFKFMCDQEYINRNYMASIAKPRNNDIERIKEERIKLDDNDFKEIINNINSGVGSSLAKAKQEKFKNRDMLIMLILMTTGIRKTALASIDVSDINLSKREFIVVDKGSKTHTYKLSNSVFEVMEIWLKQRSEMKHETDALFLNKNGTRMSDKAIYELVKKYSCTIKEGGISPHKIRSGFCTIMYDKTKDLDFVCKAVGHSNVIMTQRYIASDAKEKEKASSMIDDIISS